MSAKPACRRPNPARAHFLQPPARPSPAIPAQNQARHTRAESGPPYRAHPLRHTRAELGPSYPRSPRVSRRDERQARLPPPKPRTRTLPPAPARPSPAIPAHPLRHTRAELGPPYPRRVRPVIPAQSPARHTRAKIGPSYPRSPRVSRRDGRQARLPPPKPRTRAPLSRHTRARRGYLAVMGAKPVCRRPNPARAHFLQPPRAPLPPYPRRVRSAISAQKRSAIPAQKRSVIPALAAGISP